MVARLLTASLVRVHRGEGIVRHVLLTASPVRVHRGKGIVRNVISVRSVWFYRIRLRKFTPAPPAVGCVPQSKFEDTRHEL